MTTLQASLPAAWVPPGAADPARYRWFWSEMAFSIAANYNSPSGAALPADPNHIAAYLRVPAEEGGVFAQSELDNFASGRVRNFLVGQWTKLVAGVGGPALLEQSIIAVSHALSMAWFSWAVGDSDGGEPRVQVYSSRYDNPTITRAKLLPLVIAAQEKKAPPVRIQLHLGDALAQTRARQAQEAAARQFTTQRLSLIRAEPTTPAPPASATAAPASGAVAFVSAHPLALTVVGMVVAGLSTYYATR